jgi:uncharacterized membrane protein YhaH (DUF805 family)
MPWLILVVGAFLLSELEWGSITGSPEGRESTLLRRLISQFSIFFVLIMLVAGVLVALGLAQLIVRPVSDPKEVPR